MFAQYSPLFTSGLLSESNTPSSSRMPSVERCSKEPRESLPVDASTDSLYETTLPPLSEDDTVFFTFMPRRRRVELGNSFLSLDLAESQSMRSMSLRRKDTITSRATTHFGRSAPGSPSAMFPIPPMPFASFSQLGSPELARKSLVRHSSREGLPGAKPAPSSQLPAVPRRRPADLAITLSTCFSPVTSTSSSSSGHRSVHSEPSVLSPISPLLSPVERSYFAFSSPLSPSLTDSFVRPAQISSHGAPPTTSLHSRPSMRSTASFKTRQVNRSAALAALEGRNARRQHYRSRPSNFMSMSDDEDDIDLDDIVTTPPPPASAPAAVAVQAGLLEVLQEEEDVVVPSPAPSRKRLSSPPSSRKTRSRRGTLESLLFPLTNFIDFRDSDDGASRSWRSFVEIS
ncbi:hypothetical protein C8Q80DRAFT_160397 [Daedaleopsis nitida]|nr:hypothetical protein C8Q80DRAFT_160397 [Daedaleopsis nitida]